MNLGMIKSLIRAGLNLFGGATVLAPVLSAVDVIQAQVPTIVTALGALATAISIVWSQIHHKQAGA